MFDIAVVSDLSGNQLEGSVNLLPDTLESLTLNNNSLTDLPAQMPSKLRTINIAYNQFQQVYLPLLSPRLEPSLCVLYRANDTNCFLNVTLPECGSCFGPFGCSRREMFNPGCVPLTTTAMPTTTDNVASSTSMNANTQPQTTTTTTTKSIGITSSSTIKTTTLVLLLLLLFF